MEQDVLDQVVVKAISDVLGQRLPEAAVERALQTFRSGQDGRLNRQKVIERELSLIEAHERNLVDAIAHGEHMDPLLARLKAEENRKKAAIAELNSLTKSAEVIDLDRVRLRQDLKKCVSDARSLLQRQTSQARQILSKLIEKAVDL